MKKVVFGGFCIIAAILLFWMSDSITFITGSSTYASSIPEFILKILSVGLGVFGFTLGIKGLREKE